MKKNLETKKKLEKNTFLKHWKNIKSIWKEKGTRFYVYFVQQKLPHKKDTRIRNVMLYGIVDWDILKVFAEMVGYSIEI